MKKRQSMPTGFALKGDEANATGACQRRAFFARAASLGVEPHTRTPVPHRDEARGCKRWKKKEERGRSDGTHRVEIQRLMRRRPSSARPTIGQYLPVAWRGKEEEGEGCGGTRGG